MYTFMDVAKDVILGFDTFLHSGQELYASGSNARTAQITMSKWRSMRYQEIYTSRYVFPLLQTGLTAWHIKRPLTKLWLPYRPTICTYKSSLKRPCIFNLQNKLGTHHGVPYIFSPNNSMLSSSRYVQLVKYWRTLSACTASVMFSSVLPSFGKSFNNDVPVCTQRSVEADLLCNGFVNVWSKLSSWLPAMTSLCWCGNWPIFIVYKLDLHTTYKCVLTSAHPSRRNILHTYPCVELFHFHLTAAFGKVAGMNENIAIRDIELDVWR